MARHIAGNCAWSYSLAAPVALIGLNPSRARPSALIDSGAMRALMSPSLIFTTSRGVAAAGAAACDAGARFGTR
ncbi:hypothetical protein G6F61_015265 [Rhizopus arrhizus]|nr:hypothetical protein G6F61_015265 [Rhizopus arrhizus]